MPTLAELTTLGLGGPARRIVDISTADDLRALPVGEPLLVVGGGSNLVVADDGVDATVARIGVSGLHIEGDRVRVGAGEPWDDVVTRLLAAGRTGFATLSGIPGSTGATPIQNVGAYGTEVAEYLVAVTVFDRPTGMVKTLRAAELALGYRTSALRGRTDRIVLEVIFELPSRPVGVRYAELARRLGVAPGTVVPDADVRSAVLELRRSKGMVLDPGDPDSRSAGSFFTNPILAPKDLALTGAAVHQALGPVDLPSWDMPGSPDRKLSAAWLIERAGFTKGYPGPGAKARISTKHTLALVNSGGTTHDLIALAREIRDGVREKFAVTLHPEPVFVGVRLD